MSEFAPSSFPALAEFVAANAVGQKQPLQPVGGGTSLHLQPVVSADSLRIPLSGFTQVIDYPARDMTVTAEAGIRVADLQATLRKERQRLAVDIPQAAMATLGGAVAANASGPRRYGHGTLRDAVIGISGIDAQGRQFKAGGRVVKNVAGYDLCKLLIGSQGTLAIVTQLTLKLKPLAEATGWLWVALPDWVTVERAVIRLLHSAARPVVMDALNTAAAVHLTTNAAVSLPTTSPVLVLAVEGTASDVAWQLETLAQELREFHPPVLEIIPPASAAAVDEALTDFQMAAAGPVRLKANLLSSGTAEFMNLATQAGFAAQAHLANGIVHAWIPQHASAELSAEMIAPLRKWAHQHQGNLVLWEAPSAWQPLAPSRGRPEPATPVMEHLKRELDPHNLLNRGRMFIQ